MPVDTGKLKDNFALVGANGVDVADYFYADLFAREPQLRSMFPAAMARQHEVLLAALSQIVSSVDDTDALVPFLRDLGRRHHGFGVVADHYAPVGASLLATLAYFSGPAWSEDLERDWAAAYGLVAKVMSEAAAEPVS
ncbi:globin domain-containing protein [Actinomadura madurae]|uniref:globin domain-containing protein n=1 Tax=Actinomadura madurae TaxID=1993 RepID=UPI0020261969|nr:globin domain-containing protein [Actinomadura madurae]URM99889.1 globin domain-containing protein [Actinomadura madurae]URN02057.1 globin domain-containing protein [Actinomadura madurae]